MKEEKIFFEKECVLGSYFQSSFRENSPMDFHLLFREAALEAELPKPGNQLGSPAAARGGIRAACPQRRPTFLVLHVATDQPRRPLSLVCKVHYDCRVPSCYHLPPISALFTLGLFPTFAPSCLHRPLGLSAQRFWITKAPRTGMGLPRTGKRVCALSSCKPTMPSRFPSFL